MSKDSKPRMWDVGPDGNPTPLRRSTLESDAFRPGPPALLSKVGTREVAVGYAAAGGALAWLWGSSGVVGFLGNALFWPLILGFKAVSMVFPLLLIAAAGGGAWWWLKGRGGKGKDEG